MRGFSRYNVKRDSKSKMKDVLPKRERIEFIDPMQYMQPAVDRLLNDIGTRILFTLREYCAIGNGTQIRVKVRALLATYVDIYHRLPHDDDALIMTHKSIEGCFLTAIMFLINDGFIKIGPPVAGEFKDREILDYHEAAFPNFRGEKFRQ